MQIRTIESMPGYGTAVWPGTTGEYPSLHEFLVREHQRLGGAITMQLNGLRVISLASPAALRESRELFDQPLSMLEAFRPLFTKDSIAFANGDEGRFRRREYLDPPFTRSAVQVMLPTFVDGGRRLVEAWGRIGLVPFDLHHATTQVALEVFVAASLGLPWSQMGRLDKFAESHLHAWNALDGTLSSGARRCVASEVPVAPSIAHLHATIRSIIDPWLDRGGKVTADPTCPLLVRLLVAAGAPRERALAEAVTTVIAGFHPTAALLTWSFIRLALDGELQEAVRHEVKSAGLARADGPPVSPARLRECRLLRATLDEVLRFDCIAPMALRCSDADEVIAGFTVPAGTPIVQALSVAANDPSLWGNPEVFDPHRFMRHDGVPSRTFFPFGFAGQRGCPGLDFTYVEAAILMAFVLANFELILPGGKPPARQYGIVTTPATEVLMHACPLSHRFPGSCWQSGATAVPADAS